MLAVSLFRPYNASINFGSQKIMLAIALALKHNGLIKLEGEQR
jgi:hypothetical protein